MVTPYRGGPPSYEIVSSATQTLPAPRPDYLGAGRGWVRATPLAEVLDADEAFTRLRELEDGVAVVHRVGAIGVTSCIGEVVFQPGANRRLVHAATTMPEAEGDAQDPASGDSTRGRR